MSRVSRISAFGWIVVLALACGFLLWLEAGRIRRVEAVSDMVGTEAVADPASPTGYAGGLRRFIVPEHNNDSYQWIAQTQQMLADGEWRVRHVDYDNAPLGREVRSPSPYRWWLGFLAWVDHHASGRPLGQAVDQAALYSDALLHLLLLVGGAGFVAWRFGAFPAGLLSLALTAVFPLGGAFLPGQPDDHGLALLGAFWSVMPILAAILPRRNAALPPREAGAAPHPNRQWFLIAGVAGGFGLWVSPAKEIVVLAGMAVGGLLAAWAARTNPGSAVSVPLEKGCWRIWAISGGLTTLGAYLAEFFPAHLGGLRLDAVHPLFGLAWLGTGELLEWATARLGEKNDRGKIRDLRILAPAVLAVTAAAVAIARTGDPGFFRTDSLANRLTNLPDGVVANNVVDWLQHDGFSTMAAATFIPLLLLVPALWLLTGQRAGARHRSALALALGPVLLTLLPAVFLLRWWNVLDVALLMLLTAVAATMTSVGKSTPARWFLATGVILGLAPGVTLFFGRARLDRQATVTGSDVIALVERDLSHWLASQAGAPDTVVLAPPNLTTSIFFHGGLTGLCSPYWENIEGFKAAVRIVGATSPDEAQAVARSRHVTYLVLPSWDTSLEKFSRLGGIRGDHSLVAMLQRWLPPRWLQPIPYHLPKIPGFEGLSVVIFEVVEVQDNVTALSHLGEYFAEMEQPDRAAAVSQALERLYPGELGALVARAEVAQARSDPAAFAAILGEISPFLARGDDQTLAWERRVSLAIVLAEGKLWDPAREQVRRCLAEIDEPLMRSLTTVSLYRLELLGKAMGVPMADPKLRELGRRLLPPEMREHL
jgi:hypothetical protein